MRELLVISFGINSNWRTPKWISSMLLLGFFPLSILGQDPEVIRTDVSLVTVNVAVRDTKGRPLSGLKAENFLVRDENSEVTPQFFDSEGPASIVFVVDISSSMQGERWHDLLVGLRGFLKTAREGNDYTLVVFEKSPHLIAQSVGAEELVKSLKLLKPHGDTALYDGVLMGLDALKQAPQRRKAIVLVSDGEDNSSRKGLSEIAQEVAVRHATIYSVGLLLKGLCGKKIYEACHGKEVISDLANVTGGLAQFPNSHELARTLKEISDDIRCQYSLSDYPPDKRSGWRRVQVNVAPADRRSNLRYQERYLMR